MTISLERSIADNNPRWAWLVGNARLINFSGQLLGAHLAHAGLIMFWAGITTMGEVWRYQPELTLAEQHFWLLPHLASLGWGVGAGGEITETDTYLAIGAIHLIASAVLAAGGLFHVVRGPADLGTGSKRIAAFHYTWDDSRQLGLILGHHLIFLGLGALGLVLKAMVWGGIYDAQQHQVRLVSNPTLDPGVIFGYLRGLHHGLWNPLGMAAVDSLEDIIGGHIYIAILLIAGGVWHITVPMMGWAKKILAVEADAILSYSLGGLALMAFISAAFVGFNTTAFPIEFYGVDRANATAGQFFLGLLSLVGHLWHAYRAGYNKA
jgi:photosystem II CP43 chlorophyll apoprotein